MRHLTRQFAIGALQRGRGIEQFLGPASVRGAAGIRWVQITPRSSRYRISLHTVEDPDDDRCGDLTQLVSLDPADEEYVGEGLEVGVADDAAQALSLAEDRTAAVPGRWVNASMAGDEYVDHVRARRSPHASATAGPSPSPDEPTVDITRIRTVFGQIADLLEREAGPGQSVTLPYDLFWSVPADARYTVTEEPGELTIGSLSDALANLDIMAEDPDATIKHALIWLSDVLRALGDA
ncbi:hypothetical protein [Kineosporia babensis]|uniref:Uncharacterized protein n=1 Tax=Kineosporia babensis TaxID=499548 RepID=A0A9X1SY70_9ACTN|nr:hypothetical protein [Kineosporia babensis]MCD5310753.1 hypothetical protein [Kineosporia babensis]